MKTINNMTILTGEDFVVNNEELKRSIELIAEFTSYDEKVNRLKENGKI